MIKQRVLLTLALLLLALPVPAVAESGADQATTFLWRVHGDNATVYLLGSVHAMREDSYPLPPAMETAFDSVEKLVFEVDLDDLGSAAIQMLAAGTLDGEETLEEIVGPASWTRLMIHVEKTSFPSGMFQRMKPWMAAVTITALAMTEAGYLPSAGIDAYFSRRAEETGKERIALETVEFQVGLFAGLTAEQSLAFLRYTLVDLETVIPELDELLEHWRAGEVAAVEALMAEGFDEFPELLDTMVTDRNRTWMAPIEGLLAGDSDAMVVVGALHLVGEEGVVNLLRKKGYTVER
jgi:uncharacterized protein YbaP (TraB family)